MVIRSSLFGGDGADTGGARRHVAKIQVLARVASGADLVCMQEACRTDMDYVELHDFLPGSLMSHMVGEAFDGILFMLAPQGLSIGPHMFVGICRCGCLGDDSNFAAPHSRAPVSRCCKYAFD